MAFAAALLTFRLAGLLGARYRSSRRPELLAWAVGLGAYAVAAAAIAWGEAAGWDERAFRVYYAAGALLTAPLLGAGSLLLAGRRRAGPVALVYAGLAVGVALAVPVHGAFAAHGDLFTRGAVDTYLAFVPTGGLAPGDRGCGDSVGAETHGPREELRPPAAPVPGPEQAGEPEGEQCGGERHERVHVRQPRSLRSQRGDEAVSVHSRADARAARGARSGRHSVVHHRSPDFRPIYERVLARLREVCRTQSDVLLFGASGTGAFESAVANLVTPGERHFVVSAGNFGERWVSMIHGVRRGGRRAPLRLRGETQEADDLRARLGERQAKAVLARPVRDLDRGRRRCARARGCCEGGGGARRRRRRLEPRRRPLRYRRLGARRRRLGLAEGADGAARVRPRRRLGGPSRQPGPRRASTSIGRGRGRRSRRSTRPSRLPCRSSPVSTSRSGCCSPRIEAFFERHVRLGRAARAGVKGLGLELFARTRTGAQS